MTGLTTDTAPDGTPRLIHSDGPNGAYWTALADVRACFQRMRAAGPTADDATKRANLADFTTRYAAASDAAEAAGIGFALADVMGF